MKKALVTFDDGHALTERDFMSSIDNELIRLHDTGDTIRATRLLDGLDDVDNVAGHAKAKFLWGYSEWWRENKPDEDFADHIDSTSKRTRKITVKRYVATWRHVENHDIPKAVAVRPMRELIPIAAVLSQGYEIGIREWRKIELCSNEGELREVLRQIKGKPAKKGATVLHLERDGTMTLWVTDKTTEQVSRKFIGFLNIKDAESDPDIAKVIEKIKAIGIIED